jgi:tRNA wybutosine-synthesizing protein 2
MVETPLIKIKKSLSKEIPKDLVKYLPEKWEKIGDVLIIKFNDVLKEYKDEICQKYTEILQCKTILNDIGGISGKYRKPKVKMLYGSKDTETSHKENGIKYKLDPCKIMFSSGNMNERIRMAGISNENETVVDLFTGIGYFTLPIAVYSRPKKIFSCEINPDAYRYLCENIVLNHVTKVVEPLLGDNRINAPKNVADRVIMGYINNTHKFLSTAINCLKNQKGIIHYHDVFPNELIPQKPLKVINDAAGKYRLKLNQVKHRFIKSYAPGISHIVFDIEIGDK